MLKRIGSLLLSLALCITMIPMPTFAAEPTTVSSTPTGTALTQDTFDSYTTETDILRKANGVWLIKTGNYYLDGDITLDRSLCLYGSEVTLDLNGHMLAVNGNTNVIEVTNNCYEDDGNTNGKLTLKDSQSITGKTTYWNNDDGLWKKSNTVTENTTTGGYITGGKGEFGGCICVKRGKLIMESGTIVGNEGGSPTGSSGYSYGIGQGGGVYVSVNGTFEMNGGTIVGNKAENGWGKDGDYAYKGEGGGVFVCGGTFTMNGGSIINNTAKSSGGGVGLLTFNLNSDDTFTCPKFTMTAGTISGNLTKKRSGSDGGGGVYMYSGTFNMSNGTISNNISDNDNDAAYGGGGVCFRGSNVDSDPRSFTMSGNASITGNQTSGCGGGVHFSGVQSSTFTMSGNASITDNEATKYNGGGVYVDDKATVIMSESGNKISGNHAVEGGGGVYMFDINAAFKMQNGSISGNYADTRGGGVHVNSGTFEMSGGSITDNHQVGKSDYDYYGGGISVYLNSVFKISGNVQIKNNTQNAARDSSTGAFSGGTASNVYLNKYSEYEPKITITGALNEVSDIGVLTSTYHNKTFTSGWNTYMSTAAPADYFTSDDSNYIVMKTEDGELKVGQHTHNWMYAAEGEDTIKATCSASDCPNENSSGGSIKIKAPADLIYDGTDKAAALEGSFTTGITNPTASDITYKVKNGETWADLPAGTTVPKNTGTYKASITIGSGDNAKTASVNYTITSKNVTADELIVSDISDQTYTGSDLKPEPTVKYGTKQLVKDTDYTLSYSNNKNAGTATVTVTAKTNGNYAFNPVPKNFKINKATPNVSVDSINVNYDGYSLTNEDISGSSGKVNGKWSWKDGNAPKNVTDSTSDSKTWKVVFTPNDSANYNSVEKNVNVTINPKILSISGLTATDREYDGTTTVALTGGTLNGVLDVDKDNVTVVPGNGTIADADIGQNKPIKTLTTKLSGSAASNYILTLPEGITVNITAKTVDLDIAVASAGTYDGNAKTPKVTVKVKNTSTTLIKDKDYTVRYENNIMPGTDTAKVIVTAKEGSNYTWTPAKEQTFSIGKKAANNREVYGTSEVMYGNSKDVTFGGLIYDGDNNHTVTYDSCTDTSVLDGTPSIIDNGTTLIFKIKDDDKLVGKTATIKVKVTSDIYADYLIAVNVKVKDKTDIGEFTVNPITAEYTGEVLSTDRINVSGLSIDGAFSWKDGNAPKNVSDSTSEGKTWKVVFTPTNSKYKKVEKEVNVTITPKTLNISGVEATDRRYIAGDKEVTLTGGTLSGVVTGDSGNVGFNLGKGTMDNGNVGVDKTVTTNIKLTGTAAGNYTLTQPTGIKATISKADPTYTVPIDITAVYGQTLGDVSLSAYTGWSWKDSTESVGNASDTPKTFKAKYTPADTNNYNEVSDIDISVKVNKASYGNKTADKTVKYGSSGSVDLSGYIVTGGTASCSESSVTDTDSVLDGTPSIATDGKTLNFKFKNDSSKVDKSAAIAVKVTSDNYADYTITVTAKVGDKATPDVTVNPIIKDYTGAALTNSDISGSSGDITGTWSWKEGKAPKNVTDSTSDSKTWTVVFTPTDSVNYKAVETVVSVTINPVDVTISGLSVSDKTYDRTKTADVTGTPAITGKIGEDVVTVKGGKAEFADKNVGKNKAVTFSGYSIEGKDAGNYNLKAQPSTVYAEIKAKDVTVSGVTGVDRPYNETTKVSLSGGTVDGVISGDTVTVDLANAYGTVASADADETVKNVTVTGVEISGADAANYKLNGQPTGATVKITKASYGNKTADSAAKYGSSGSVDLSRYIVTGGTASYDSSAVTDTNSVLSGTPSIAADGKTLKYDFVSDSNKVGNTVDLVVKVTSNNYEDYTITVTAKVEDKTVPTLTLTPSKDTMSGSGTVTLTVGGLPENAACTVTCDNTEYNPTGSGTSWSVALPNTTATYTFTVNFAEDDNYKSASATCTVSVTKKNGNGGGGITPTEFYSINVAESDNGSVTVDTDSAEKGDTVTITVKPDNGYVMETIKATDSKGNAIELTNSGNGKYTFKMPASEVKVEAEFTEDNSMINFFVDVPSNEYYYDAVMWAVRNGITEGTSETTFSPDLSCTRAQIVTFLWRAAGSPEPTNASSFYDVPADAYYAKAVAWAIENGITSGIGDNMFGPDMTCTRSQAVTFLYRTAKTPAVINGAGFIDVPADAYFANAVTWAEQNEITGGIGDSMFGPDYDCTRAQIVTFLYRYFV